VARSFLHAPAPAADFLSAPSPRAASERRTAHRSRGRTVARDAMPAYAKMYLKHPIALESLEPYTHKLANVTKVVVNQKPANAGPVHYSNKVIRVMYTCKDTCEASIHQASPDRAGGPPKPVGPIGGRQAEPA